MFHLRVVLVLTMVQSQPHHLRYQWPQINIFASLNHIHHHTYFKYPYAHVQMFHILHHHTMKLLQASKSFMIGGIYCRKLAVKTGSLLATQFGSENWFVAGRAIQHRKLFRCKHLNFDSECYFAAANTLSAANANLLQRTQFRQQITNSLQTT